MTSRGKRDSFLPWCCIEPCYFSCLNLIYSFSFLVYGCELNWAIFNDPLWLSLLYMALLHMELKNIRPKKKSEITTWKLEIMETIKPGGGGGVSGVYGSLTWATNVEWGNISIILVRPLRRRDLVASNPFSFEKEVT